MAATVLPGLAASAADTAAAGPSAAGAAPSAGAGSVAACAALGAVSGLVLVRAISWLHFISGGIPIACVRLFLDDNRSAPDMKSSRSADIFRSCRKQRNPGPAQAESIRAGVY
jgi:hypothetical protein